MDVSLIIVNYNTSKLLYECLSSIIDKTKNVNYEIIIVDNASSDNSLLMVKENFPHVCLIENKNNLGFGRANNIGAKLASGKYLFFLNTDILLINNSVKILYDFMEEESSKNIGACGGNLFKNDLSPNFSYSLYFPSLFGIFCYRAHLTFLLNNEYFNRSSNIKDVALIIGADLFVRKNLFDDLNGFDPLFFMYVEDTELSYRIHKLNYRITSNPKAKIIHLQGKSSTSIFKLKNEIDGYVIYFKKHHKPFVVKIYILIELFSAFTRLTLALFTFKLSKGYDYFQIIKFLLKIE